MTSRRWSALAERGVLLGLFLIPLLWFRHGALLASVDTLLPQPWEQNLELLHAWNHRLGTGTIHLFDGAAFLFNVIPATVLWLGGSLLRAQQAEFCFWYGLAGWSMAEMMRRLYIGPHPRMARVIAAVFYACNLYVVPIWVGFNKPNIALYALLPLLLAWYLQMLWGTKPAWPTMGMIALTSLAASTVGTNTPVAAVGGITIGVVTIIAVISSIRHRAWGAAYRQLWVAGALAALVVAVHAFWIVPQVRAGLVDVAHSPLQDARAQALSYMDGISRFTSVFNVIRLQGDWVWYATTGEPYVLYANHYLQSPLFILLSWAMVAAVAVGMLAPKIRYRTAFVAIAAVGLCMSMGTHPWPTGWLFRWAVDHVPGFWMFRSAWYKFMAMTCLGYAFFLGVAAAWLATWWRGRPPAFAGGAVLALVLIYAHPVIAGAMFPTAAQRTAVPPLQFTVPAHVEAAAAWFRTQPRDGRVFALPGRGVWANRWGYPGLIPFLWYRVPQPWVYEMDPAWQMVSQGAPQEALEITKLIRQSLNPYRGNLTPRLDRLLRILGVRHVMHETDYRYDLLPLLDSPDQMRQRLHDQRGLVRAKVFGAWEIYEVPDPMPAWSIASGVTVVRGDQSWFAELSRTELLDHDVLWWADETSMPQLHALREQGLIRRVVLAGNPRTPHLDPTVPVTILASSARLATLEALLAQQPLSLSSHGIRWQWGPSVEAREAASDHAWRWTIPNNDEPALVVTNPYPWPVSVMLTCELMATRPPRRLFLMVNRQPVQADLEGTTTTILIGAGSQRVLLPPVRFLPGDNVVQFLTTEPWEQTPGRPTAFAIRDVQVGDPTVHARITIPRDETYRVRLYPQYEGALTDREAQVLGTRVIRLGREEAQPGPGGLRLGREEAQPGPGGLRLGLTEVSLTAQQDTLGLRYWESPPMALSAGPVSLEAVTRLGDGWVAEFESVSHTSPSAPPQALVPSASSPTAHTLDFQLTRPALLVFNESYHPSWSAHHWNHLRVNGFANAWVVPAGRHRVQVAFASQQWSRRGQWVSVMAALGLAVSLGLTGVIMEISRWWIRSRSRQQ